MDRRVTACKPVRPDCASASDASTCRRLSLRLTPTSPSTPSFKDIAFAVRSLRRQPGFAIVTILTLALGIGANTAVFSVVNGVLLRPLPYPAPERLEFITSQFPTIGFDQFWISLPEFVEFRDHNQAFASVGAYSVGAANLGTAPPSRPVRGARHAGADADARRASRSHGRWFTAADTVPERPAGRDPLLGLWQSSFGGDPTIVGKTCSSTTSRTSRRRHAARLTTCTIRRSRSGSRSPSTRQRCRTRAAVTAST